MMNQRTIKSSFSLQGIGLHTGLNITITFNPASENHGYKIRRTDISGKPAIDAIAENVIATQRGTVLGSSGLQVSTVEHALAALYASEIDNCLIDVDGPEFPILDGSSIYYINKIKEVGFVQQITARKYISFEDETVRVFDDKTGSYLVLLPDDKFSIQTHIDFDSPVLKPQDALLINFADFEKHIASSRTFVFVREIEPLLYNNLIKGGDLDNAIVIYDKPIAQDDYDRLADKMGTERKDASQLGYIMNKPLIYPNEPARHKLLDVIGDIALTGYFIKGKIIANCPGHYINNLFARAIREKVEESVLVEF